MLVLPELILLKLILLQPHLLKQKCWSNIWRKHTSNAKFANAKFANAKLARAKFANNNCGKAELAKARFAEANIAEAKLRVRHFVTFMLGSCWDNDCIHTLTCNGWLFSRTPTRLRLTPKRRAECWRSFRRCERWWAKRLTSPRTLYTYVGIRVPLDMRGLKTAYKTD